MYNEQGKNEYSIWILTAMAAPVIQAASNCSWPVVLVIGVLCLGICAGMERFDVGRNPGKWIGSVQWLWMLLVISEFMHWVMFYWPVNQNYHALPILLLALAAYASAGGAERAARAGAAMRWFLLLLIGAVLLSGIGEVDLENLAPSWDIQTAHLVTVMLLPAMGISLSNTKQKTAILLFAVLVSAVTVGVLSMTLISQMEAPFYEMSRSLTLLGIGQRFESLVAAGVTLGYYVLLSYLVTVTANAWEMGKRHNRSVWITAVFVALVFLSGMRLNSRILALGTIGVWVVLPIFKKVIKFEK